MPQWIVKDFGGEVPKRDPRLLPDNMAEDSVNVDHSHGTLTGLPQPEFIVDLSGAPWPVRKAYRFPGPTSGDPDVWLPLPSEFSSVVRSPLTNDTEHRIYWTNPPGQPNPGFFTNTYARIKAGNTGANAPFNVGFIAPPPSLMLSVSVAGGDTTVPQIGRSYVFTYVDSNGLESSPSLPSNVVEGAPDGTWTVSGFPAMPPANPTGKSYPIPVTNRLYRTVTGATTGGQYFFVANVPVGTTSYTDTIPDASVTNNNTLGTASWIPPPDGLDGLIAMPGGMLIGFTGNTVHFCEPYLPHTWPAGYDLGLLYPIVAFAVWQQSLVALTQGYPSTGVGNSPSQFVFAQVQAPEPCIARGSVVTDLAGVYYASQNGLVALNYFGMQNQTLSNMSRKLWLTEYQATKIIACRHRAQYLAVNGTGMGFIINYEDQRQGIVHTNPMVAVVSVWNDVYTGDAYMVADNKVFRWDSITTPPLNYRWRSKQFYWPAPLSIGAIQVLSEPAITRPAPPIEVPPPDWVDDPCMDLPAGVNGRFILYAGQDQGKIVAEYDLHKPREIFRVPGGFKTFTWQFEILGRVSVRAVELATTMHELKAV